MVTSTGNGGETEARPALEPITADELIDDRALTSDDDDEFGLHDFVAELAQRCRVMPTPANVALYGAWGSGKTSLGNLLEAAFEKDPLVAFGRFDAFKFAEVPLRRHFLASVAAYFKIKGDTYSKDLYRTKKEQNFSLTKKSAGEFLLAILVAAAALTLIMVAAAAAISLIAVQAKTASFGSTLVTTLRSSAPGILIAAPIVAAVLALAFHRFDVVTETSAPFSDEEFEKLFIKLVATVRRKTNCKRVLVFIDELDRCSPKQVGSALETLRTFLDVRSCIFVVAADQQVLEHALMEGGARQATPSNDTNPYYSSGSAYLDKIFHYQIPLPPLLSRRLSQFAVKLIQARAGAWRRVPNQAELISVLVPTHVRSPRRVKTLLNTFVSLYRLAILRAADGRLDPGIEARASEVGKLVCLRTEFPLFARDLTLDDRLPDVVLRLHDNPNATLESLKLPGLSSETFERARAYAKGERPVADLLAASGQVVMPSAKTATDAASEDRDEDDQEDEPQLEADEDAGSLGDAQRAYAQQLIRYLQRTKAIAGPRRDLIYLESSGVAFGLPAELADRLENDAVDGRSVEVARQIENLDAANQLAACRLLAQLIVERALGLETPNVTRSLFAALSATTEDLSSVANDVLTALTTYSDGYALAADDLEGALRLALSSQGTAARQMRVEIMAREEIISDENLGIAVLRDAPNLVVPGSNRLSVVLAARLADTQATDVVEALATASDQLLDSLVRDIPAPVTSDADVDTEQTDEPTLPVDLGEFAIALLDAKREIVAASAFDRLLALDSLEGRNEGIKIIDRFAPISDEERAKAVLQSANRRQLLEWPVWLKPIASDSLKLATPGNEEVILTAVKALWNNRFTPAASVPPATGEQFDAAVQALAPIPDARPLPGDAGLGELLAATAPSPVTTEAEITPRQEQYTALRKIAASGLVAENAVAGVVLTDLNQTLDSPVLAAVPSEPLATWVYDESIRVLKDAEAEAIVAFQESIASSAWLDADTHNVITLITAAELRARDSAVSAPFTAAEIAALLATGVRGADEATSRWIEEFRPGAAELLVALRIHADEGLLTARLHEALNVLADVWGAEDKADLFESLAPPYIEGSAEPTLLRDLRMGGADQDRLSKTLCSLFHDAGNNEERERILRLWEIAQPSGQKARAALVENVFLPLVGGGKGQVKIALDHFNLVIGVGKTMQTKIKRALDDSTVGEKDLQKTANRVLREVGWIKKPRFNPFGKS